VCCPVIYHAHLWWKDSNFCSIAVIRTCDSDPYKRSACTIALYTEDIAFWFAYSFDKIFPTLAQAILILAHLMLRVICGPITIIFHQYSSQIFELTYLFQRCIVYSESCVSHYRPVYDIPWSLVLSFLHLVPSIHL
jgi:hypothetical protein